MSLYVQSCGQNWAGIAAEVDAEAAPRLREGTRLQLSMCGAQPASTALCPEPQSASVPP